MLKPVYVSRKVINNNEVHNWYINQNISDIEPAERLHVTVAYSREPVNVDLLELDTGQLTIPASVLNSLTNFGDYLVQLVPTNIVLFERFFYFRNHGCSWDHDNYQPHISISQSASYRGVQPFNGEIILGPEIAEDLK